MVQRLFADVIHEAIWFMNIHEQKYPWFLAKQNCVQLPKLEIMSYNGDKQKFKSFGISLSALFTWIQNCQTLRNSAT